MKYIVKRGDTLNRIAVRHALTTAQILEANPQIGNRNRILVGQEIEIPAPTSSRRPVVGAGRRPTVGREDARASRTRDAAWGELRFLDWLRGLPLAPAPAGGPGDEPAWMKTAKGEIGVAEVAGKTRANPRILEYFKASKYWGKDDTGAKNAWCGSFVAWVMEQNGFTPVSKAFRAKQWKSFGKTIEDPIYGAIGIKSRRGGGHVAFVVGKSADGKKLYMLGGNQDDKVQISEYRRSVWETFVVPATYDATKGKLPVYDRQTAKAGREH